MATTETKIKITADTSSAERAINNLEKSLQDIEKVSNGAAKALGVITAAAGAMTYAIASTIKSIGDLGDMADALGMSAQNLGYLQQSAQLAGIGADELNSALMRLRGNIGQALVEGSGAAYDALDRLGLSMSELSRMPADQQLTKINAALKEIPNPAQRSALAIDLLGKQGPRLLEAADAMTKMQEQAKKLGIALSDIDVQSIRDADDSLTELEFIFKGALKQAAAAIAPYIVAIVNNIKDAIEEAGGLSNIIRSKIIPTIKLAVEAMIIFAGIWAAGVITSHIVAITAGIVQMYKAIKLATTAMEFLNAVAGKNPIIKIAGLIAGLVGAFVAVKAVDKVFDGLDKQAEEILGATAAKVEENKKQTQEWSAATDELNKKQKNVLKALDESISKLEDSVKFEKEKLALGEATANANKMIAEEERKLAEAKLKMSDPDKQRIRDAYASLEALKQQETINKAIKDLDSERLYITIADKNEREIAQTLAKTELDIKRSLTNEEKDRLTNAIKLTQQAREQGQIAEAIYNYTRQQTELEKINRGIQLQGTVNPMGTLTKEYARDEEALKAMLDRKLISEMEYYAQREVLAKQYNDKIRDIEMKRIEDTLAKQTGAIAVEMSERDRSILQAVGQQERQRAIAQERIAFEKKSEVEKFGFIIDQGAQMFSALGAQNKRAFEAAKAFNIANAIMNTYMAATKALATYPWPFGLVAAAAAVGMGLAQVAQIRAQSYSGRALGGPVMGGQTYMVGESGPELFTPSTTGSITRNSDLPGGNNVNVNFTIVANDTTGFDQLLASRKGVIQQIISDAMLEKGRRSMV